MPPRADLLSEGKFHNTILLQLLIFWLIHWYFYDMGQNTILIINKYSKVKKLLNNEVEYELKWML